MRAKRNNRGLRSIIFSSCVMRGAILALFFCLISLGAAQASGAFLPPGLLGMTFWRGTVTQTPPPPGFVSGVFNVTMTMATDSNGYVIMNGFNQSVSQPQYWFSWTAEGRIVNGLLSYVGSGHDHNLPFGDVICDVKGTYTVGSNIMWSGGQLSGSGNCKDYSATSLLTNLSGQTLGKEQCPTCILGALRRLPGNQDQQAAGGVQYTGEPIDLATGNVTESMTDYEATGPNRLAFTRYYNSEVPVATYASSMGRQWRTNYDRYLNINPSFLKTYVVNGSTANLIAERPDGSQLIFSLIGANWVSDSYNDATLAVSGPIYTLTLHDDTVETYLANGPEAKLMSIKYRGGYTQTLAYNSDGSLANVIDSYGRQLTFTYTSGLLTSVATPDTLMLTYAYDSSGLNLGVKDRLVSISYNTQPLTSQTYQYANPSLPFALTSITDENGRIYTSWTYDTYGRALTSRHAGGADLTTVTYNDSTDGSRLVVNSLGQQETYTFDNFLGVPRLKQIVRKGQNFNLVNSFTYDTNNFLAGVTDWDKHVTLFTNDAHGDPTTIVEGSGTKDARTTTITYDDTWVHLPKIVVTPGLTTTYTYDQDSNPLTITGTDTTDNVVPYSTSGQQRTWALTWKDFLPASLTPPNGGEYATQFTFDGSGALVGITNALGQTLQITSHTGGGRPLTILDPNNVTTTITYSPRNWLLTRAVVTSHGNLTTANTYDAVGNVIKVTQPDGSYFTGAYDAAHRLVQVADRFGNNMNYSLDAAGDATASNIQNPSHQVTRAHNSAFDMLRRKTADTNGTGWKTSYGYFNNGALYQYVPPGMAYNYTIDALNRALSESAYPYGYTYFTYDAHDRPVTVTSRNGSETSYVYDGFGDVIQQSSPDSGTTVYCYDADGNLTQKVDALGITSNYAYDFMDRISSVSYPADPPENVTYTYDQKGPGFAFGIGRLTTLKDAVGSLTRTYDERGNLIREQRISSTNVFTTTYGYDAASRLASITYPSGALVTYGRDATGRVISVTAKPYKGLTTIVASAITYEPFGPWLGLTYGNGIVETITRDADYALLTIKDIGSTSLQDSAYTYPTYDLPSTYTDKLNPANNLGISYNKLYFITQVTYANSRLTYAYDNNGNRTSSTGDINYTYGYAANSNRLTSITPQNFLATAVYTNAAGNITGYSQPYGVAGVTGLSYNNSGRLSQVSGMLGVLGTYTYDGFGNRFSKTVGANKTFYASAPDTTLLEETTNGSATDYIYLNGRPLAMLTGTTFTYLHDNLIGTPQAGTDNAQNVVWRGSYLPFGEPISVEGSVTVNLRMPGQYYDAETGFSHNGFRDYVPALGRYLEPDPIGIAGGLNTYGYALQRPVDLNDRTGLLTFKDIDRFFKSVGSGEDIGDTFLKAFRAGTLTVPGLNWANLGFSVCDLSEESSPKNAVEAVAAFWSAAAPETPLAAFGLGVSLGETATYFYYGLSVSLFGQNTVDEVLSGVGHSLSIY